MSETVTQEIQRLAAERVHRIDPRLLDGTRPLTPAQADSMLRYLRDRPVRAGSEQPVSRETPAQSSVPPPMSAFRSIPAGYYATLSRTGHNDLDFWLIQHPATGRWAGYTFVKRVLGGGDGDEMRTEQLPNMQQRLAAQAITEAGIEESQHLFADNLGRCVDCGRMLTDEVSRQARRGPTCRNRPRK